VQVGGAACIQEGVLSRPAIVRRIHFCHTALATPTGVVPPASDSDCWFSDCWC
jgi:hypothetical protein